MAKFKVGDRCKVVKNILVPKCVGKIIEIVEIIQPPKEGGNVLYKYTVEVEGKIIDCCTIEDHLKLVERRPQMSAPTYKTIRAIAREEQVTELAIWQVIRCKIVKSRVLHGDVVVNADEWDAYASSYAGKRYLKERLQSGRYYYTKMA